VHYSTRKLVKPEDLNANNTLFGGRCLQWIDEEALICAMVITGHQRIVTKMMSEINFVSPAHQGDVVEIGVELTKVGVSSITMRIVVRELTTHNVIVQIHSMVFVCVDETGKSIAHNLSQCENGLTVNCAP
jgi:acyl-CoA hydrolase